MKWMFSVLLFLSLSHTALSGARDASQDAGEPSSGEEGRIQILPKTGDPIQPPPDIKTGDPLQPSPKIKTGEPFQPSPRIKAAPLRIKIEDTTKTRLRQPKPKDDCPTVTSFRILAAQYGEMADFRLDRNNLQDYRLGEPLHFPMNCAKIYVNMQKIPGTSVYKGKIVVAYLASRTAQVRDVKFQRYRSGLTAEENKYNKWIGRRFYKPGGGGGILGKKFHAIYENKNRALIFKIDRIEARGKKDGRGDFYASGEVYYKMFRHSKTSGKNDPCWRNGVYMRDFKGDAPRTKKCWLIRTGPFNCRPMGDFKPKARSRRSPPAKRPRAPWTDIDITGRLPCYKRLGRFRNLHIKRAFNVNNIKDL